MVSVSRVLIRPVIRLSSNRHSIIASILSRLVIMIYLYCAKKRWCWGRGELIIPLLGKERGALP